MIQQFILGSQSPRRRDLLQLLGYPFETVAMDVDESLVTDLDPAVNAMRKAQLKATVIREELKRRGCVSDAILVTADTAVSIDNHVLGKPVDEADAWRMLHRLRGQEHQVHTGFTLIDLATEQEMADVHTAIVTMRNYTDEEITAYIASGDPMDKAGAYGIQHPQFHPVSRLDGCFTGVMGLSICHLLQGLSRWKIPVRAAATAVAAAHHAYACPLLNLLPVSSYAAK